MNKDSHKAFNVKRDLFFCAAFKTVDYTAGLLVNLKCDPFKTTLLLLRGI